MAPLQRTCASVTARLYALRPQVRTYAASASAYNKLSQCNSYTRRHHSIEGYVWIDIDEDHGSPISDSWDQCASFSPYLLQSFPFQKGSLKVALIHHVHRRWFSQAAAGVLDRDENRISIGPGNLDDAKEQQKDKNVVYYGPISQTIRKVKLLSLSTCCLSVSLGPVITFLTSPDLNVIVKGAVASTVIFLSASTTAALHWFASPYVHKLTWQPGADNFEVEVLSWLATYVPRTIKFSDVRPPETNRPFVTFKANGNFYFIDTEQLRNKALVAKLTPKQPNKTKQPSTASTVKNL